VELYKYDGTTFTLLATSSSSPELIAFGTNLNPYFSTLAVPETVLALTDRLAVRFYVTHSGRTITLHTEDNHLCQVITTFTTGLTALNGLTSQVQFFAVGTSGTDFGISSASDTHTFNLPTASATNRGALSSADWSTFNGKQNALTLTTTGTSGAATLIGSTLNIPQYQAAGTYVTAVTASSPLASSGGTTPNITIQQASGSQSGFLSSTDWTTFNNKQNALTNPVTGTGTTNYLPKFTGASTIGNSQVFDNGTTVGIGIITPNSNPRLHVFKGGGNFDTIVADGDAGTNTGFGIYEGGIQKYALYNNGSVNDSFNIYNTATSSNSLTIYTSGNLGINSSSDNGARFQVNGFGAFTVTGDNTRALSIIGPTTRRGYLGHGFGTLFIQNNNYYNGSNYVFDDTSVGCANVTLGQDIGFQTGAANTNPTTKAYITNSGNFGVNTINPTGRLEVVPANAGGNEGIFVNQLGSHQSTIRFKSAHSSSSDYRVGASITVGSAFEIYSIAAAASRLVITSSGNVLIGTTSEPGERITLNGRIGIVGATVASGNTRSFFVRGSQNVADGGTLSINVTNTALIFIAENNTGTGALFFCGYASGTITKISDPSNMFDVADTAGKLCIFKSAVTDVATVKNRLGSTRNITVSYIGVSD